VRPAGAPQPTQRIFTTADFARRSTSTIAVACTSTTPAAWSTPASAILSASTPTVPSDNTKYGIDGGLVFDGQQHLGVRLEAGRALVQEKQFPTTVFSNSFAPVFDAQVATGVGSFGSDFDLTFDNASFSLDGAPFVSDSWLPSVNVIQKATSDQLDAAAYWVSQGNASMVDASFGMSLLLGYIMICNL
jgi:hypothetical protein